MENGRLSSPILMKFLKVYQENPQSRVFAPLAEAYRKLGMVDNALSILNKGIRIHPEYALGYMTLASCQCDKGEFREAYKTLRPFVAANRDNVRLQDIFASICYKLGHYDEALETYKYLLFLNPQDMVAADKVKDLEEQLLARFQLPTRQGVKDQAEPASDYSEKFIAPFKINDLPVGPGKDEVDEWTQVDFVEGKEESVPIEEGESWTFQNTLDRRSSEAPAWDIEEVEEALEVEKVEVAEEVEEVEEAEEAEEVRFSITEEVDDGPPEIEEEQPVVTLTLVDLYCAQGHLDKALEVVSKILELHPGDEKALLKYNEIKSKQAGDIQEVKSSQATQNQKSTEKEEGHDDLMSHFDRVSDLDISRFKNQAHDNFEKERSKFEKNLWELHSRLVAKRELFRSGA